jgi:DNA-binding CsgD family transcriptional regulator
MGFLVSRSVASEMSPVPDQRLRTKQIADRMNIAQVTVTFHLTNAKEKLSGRTGEEALLKAVTMGLIEP